MARVSKDGCINFLSYFEAQRMNPLFDTVVIELCGYTGSYTPKILEVSLLPGHLCFIKMKFVIGHIRLKVTAYSISYNCKCRPPYNFLVITDDAIIQNTWWRHHMETFSVLLAICVGNSWVNGEFPAQRPVTRSYDAFFALRPNKRLSKQCWGWWF